MFSMTTVVCCIHIITYSQFNWIKCLKSDIIFLITWIKCVSNRGTILCVHSFSEWSVWARDLLFSYHVTRWCCVQLCGCFVTFGDTPATHTGSIFSRTISMQTLLASTEMRFLHALGNRPLVISNLSIEWLG